MQNRNPAPDPYPTRSGDEVRILERQEPVIWSAKGRTAALSRREEDFYEENGFLFLEALFNEQELAGLHAEGDRLKQEHSSDGRHDVIVEPGSEEVRSIFRLHEMSAVFERLIADERLLAIAEHILDDAVYTHQSRANFKPAFKGKEFDWHSDFETWHSEDGMPRMRALSMSITLSENTPHNGPLMLIPGSHRQFVSCLGKTPEYNYAQSLKRQRFGVPDEQTLSEMAARHGIVAPTGPAGSVLIFDCNTLHGSNSNITPWPRNNLFFVYNAVSNRLEAPFCGTEPRPEFLATRERVRPIRRAEAGEREKQPA
ncbi:MAG: ectoine hydroxylase [Rhodovibrionaceae bacterium]